MNADAPPTNGHTVASSTEARLDAIERKLDRLLGVAEPALAVAPGAMAAAADVFDEQARRAAARGVDLEARVRRLLALAETLTGDRTLDLLEALAALAPQAPGLAAMATDILDEQARSFAHEGIDLERSAKQGLRAALRFGASVTDREIEALQLLLTSPMLAPDTIRVLSMASEALAECQRQDCERVGPLGLLRALRDDDVQYALAFLINVARRFGQALHNGPPAAATMQTQGSAIAPPRR